MRSATRLEYWVDALMQRRTLGRRSQGQCIALCVATILGAGSAPVRAALGNDGTGAVTRDGGGLLLAADGDACAGAPVILGFDGTVEAGVHWRGGAVQEDYVGAFGQSFDLGPGIIRCGTFWLSQEGFYDDTPSDIYVWSRGITGEPDLVLFVAQDVIFSNVPNWPEVGENRVAIELPVEGEFTIGCWGQWPGAPGRYYYCTDADGELGPAWTDIADGYGFPWGWHHPSIVWPTYVKNMAMGVVFDSAPVATAPTTWGRIKALQHTPRTPR